MVAQSGRKPKPTAVKVLEGNPGKRSLNRQEPKPEKKAPRCPAWLEDEAKKEWKRMAKQMEQLGILTEIDMAAFAGYCQAYARWKEAEEYISEHGTVMKAPSGYCQQVLHFSRFCLPFREHCRYDSGYSRVSHCQKCHIRCQMLPDACLPKPHICQI